MIQRSTREYGMRSADAMDLALIPPLCINSTNLGSGGAGVSVGMGVCTAVQPA